MKKNLLVLLALTFTLALAGLSIAAVENGKFSVKTGDSVYVCNCGEACPCLTVGKKAGKCTCGKEMAKVTVTRVDTENAYYQASGKERSVKTTGKYACACGASCNCDYISQKPGKCSCGKDMKPVI